MKRYGRRFGWLPQAVLLLQPVLRCWAGHCRTCNQQVDLDQLTLFPRRA